MVGVIAWLLSPREPSIPAGSQRPIRHSHEKSRWVYVRVIVSIPPRYPWQCQASWSLEWLLTHTHTHTHTHTIIQWFCSLTYVLKVTPKCIYTNTSFTQVKYQRTHGHTHTHTQLSGFINAEHVQVVMLFDSTHCVLTSCIDVFSFCFPPGC